MSKQNKSGNAAKAVQEVKTAAGEKNTTGAKATLVGVESARINQRFGRITSALMTIYVLFYLCVFPHFFLNGLKHLADGKTHLGISINI